MKAPARSLVRLKKEGFQIISVEQAKGSVDYKKIRPKANVVVIFGNEVSGIPKSIVQCSDIVAEIPMKGKKESLNVSVSAGIVLFRLFD